MQLVPAAGSARTGTAPDPLRSATKANRVLVAGIALASAGIIAAYPVAPALSSDAQQAAVQLTSTTAENLDALMDLLAGPNPISSAVGELVGYYSGVAGNSFEASLAGIEGIWSGHGAALGLETILPQMIEHVQHGDFTAAYDLLNWDMLFNTQNVFQPLFDHTVRGTGEFVPGVFGLGADLTRVLANVQDVFGDFNFWKSTAKYLSEPLIGFQFALADSLTDNGDHVAQDPFDALLNGYVPWAGDDGVASAPFWGLLSNPGTVAFVLEKFPSTIADALTLNLPVEDAPEVAAAAGLSLVDLLG